MKAMKKIDQSAVTLTIDQVEELVNTITRESFPYFLEKAFNQVSPADHYIHSWHIDAMSDYLQAMKKGQLQRLIINIPPRFLKSITCSVAWPAFLLGHNPQTKIICASYGDTLVNDLSMKTKAILESHWFKTMFPNFILSRSQNQKDHFETTERGFRLGAVVGGGVTGLGADWIVVDDPIKPSDATSDAKRRHSNNWITNTLMSRDTGGRSAKIICVMQRLHENDATGLFKEMGGFEHLELPAEFSKKTFITTPTHIWELEKGEYLNPDLYGQQYLTQKRESLGEWNYACQYLQSPAPLEGGLLKKDKFKWYDDDTKPSNFKFVVHSWDTADTVTDTSAFSCCTIWGVCEKGFYLLRVINKRLDTIGLESEFLKTYHRDKPAHVLIENKSSGRYLIQKFQQVHDGDLLPIVSIDVTGRDGDKQQRFMSAIDYIMHGQVYFPQNTLWIDDYVKQLTTFPNSKFADMVDSTSQFFKWIKENKYLLDFAEDDKYYEEDSNIYYSRNNNPAGY